MGNTFFFEWEVRFAEWLQSFECGPVTALAKFFTLFGEEYLLILVLGLMYWCFSKDLGRKVSLSMCGGMMSGCLLKGVALRRRPFFDNETIKCIRAPHPDGDITSPLAQGFSMPSLHSTMSLSVYGALAWNVKKKATTFLAIFMPLFIGLSRVYLGVHYATDVLSGWGLGIISFLLFGFIEKKLGYKAAFIAMLIMSSAGLIYCRDTEYFSCFGTAIGIFLGFVIDEKFVNFEITGKWWSYIVRPLLGIVVFFGLSTLLKLAVKCVPLDDDHIVMMLLRLVRYTVSTAVTVGLYPLCFRLVKPKNKEA